ncbi:5-demethoxyubiquinol-8 5-hydroxylase UbiM [Lysobacter arenosi]|uniref:5-demethoxyubiquinol-8 5-hydroxylase UbiM n=1 Tax=Lysobacter arenosi TaxID=2795387 RepID=A0ABX7RBE2_9GAMM|nr:5-demethoxyubiquinol-8 5-hydroxylase UbiM [Lysobacter arenosi]QSX74294.1 5-demethoxyubiquinol-8 5-hydroxylase UbiM [Lysobacter arenosi]
METLDTDVTIIGAGPVGLCLARALSSAGLDITVVDRQARSALSTPAFDGREIGLTHRSRAHMQQLGLWQRLAAEDVSPLRDMQVLNGDSLQSMHVSHRGSGRDQLGYLVSNQGIRAAAFAAVGEADDIRLLDSARVTDVDSDADCARVRLEGGRELVSKLLVAADSRFSETRRAFGIGTRMFDVGRSMLVCRVTHDIPHHDIAWEWFGVGQTLARLPLGSAQPLGHRSSLVLTLPAREMRGIQALDEEAFAREMERRSGGRLGAIHSVSERHVYPLVTTYPRRFSGDRFALIGDAAVGMHPVTAHGFNFGLMSVQTLAREILQATAAGTDIAAPERLARYDREHRRATLPLYLATRGIVGLYTDDRRPVLRAALLRVGDGLVPFKRLLVASLTDDGTRLPRAALRPAPRGGA